MNIDFHYYGTYLAARLAGYMQNDAQIIAYAAQYVDEYSKDMIISEPSGLEQRASVQSTSELTQYLITPAAFTQTELSYIRRTWMSFHFLPGNFNGDIKYQGTKKDWSFTGGTWRYGAYEEQNFKLMCLPNSELAGRMINDLIKCNNLEKIGLVMHVLADTWAHSYFAGKPAWYMNEAKGDVCEYDQSAWQKLTFYYDPVFDDNISPRSYSCAAVGARYNSVGYLGHGRMGHIPDYGFMTYKYQPLWKSEASEKAIVKNNQEEFYNAFTQLVYALKCVRSNGTFKLNTYDLLDSESIRNKIKAVFADRNIDQSNSWKRCIKELLDETIPEFDKGYWGNGFKNSGKSIDTPYYRFAQCANYHVRLVEEYLIEKGSVLQEMKPNEETPRNFDDAPQFGVRNRVTKVIVREGLIVDSFKFVYDESYEGDFHGNAFGGSAKALELEQGEYITQMEYDIVDYPHAFDKPIHTVGTITFTTSKGRRLEAGEGCGNVVGHFSCTAPPGTMIFALKGTTMLRFLSNGTSIAYIMGLDEPYFKKI